MATKQEQINFVKAVYSAANTLHESDPDNTLHPVFVTAQAALETGWQIRGIGNNIFGITVGTSWTGKKALVTTKEVFSNPDKQFKEPEKVLQVDAMGGGKYIYTVKRFFRVYDTLGDCLTDHLSLLKKPMYADAWGFRHNPTMYAARLVDNTGAKYATDPNYAIVMAAIIKRVEQIVKECNL